MRVRPVRSPSAGAALPSSAPFGPGIDYPRYDGQSKCSPVPKPGVVAFQQILRARFPSVGAGHISRACSVGGQSEHKEGRALDWPVNASYASHRAMAKEVIDWLLAEDRYGNSAAMAKRLGVMYLIWNRRIWGSWGGWDTYCVQKRRGCVDPEDKDLRSPHTDHVHFSFSRQAAQKKTTYWMRARSMMAGIAAHPTYGYWQLARNGAVASYGAGWYGSRSDGFLVTPAVDVASSPSGRGYWMATAHGKVYGFGDAVAKGGLVDKEVTVVDLEPAGLGSGYWLLSRSGRVAAFGSATYFGGARGEATFAAMAATPTGQGYWLFAENGKVFPFGDAGSFGDLSGKQLAHPVVGGDNAGAGGYWLATAGGGVAAFGTAPSLGGPKLSSSPVTGFAADATGTGYWLLTEKGRLFSVGTAPFLGSLGG